MMELSAPIFATVKMGWGKTLVKNKQLVGTLTADVKAKNRRLAESVFFLVISWKCLILSAKRLIGDE